jgi:hypothetical protein
MPTKIEGLVAAHKSLLDVPAWTERGADGLDLSAPLEVDGVVVEALTLRGRAQAIGGSRSDFSARVSP